jgi:uncharacterized protein
MNPDFIPKFDVAGMLGGLVKWLRILGFDARFPVSEPTTGRIFVTAREIPGRLADIVIRNQDVMRQLRQVFAETGRRVDPKLLFSRCLECNVLVVPVEKAEIEGAVPPAVFQTAREFRKCPGCGKIFWEGSHVKRVLRRLEIEGFL